MTADLLIVGAGVAGLACAREAERLGASAWVLERSRGVGGRCATRRVDGQPMDHGVAFLHGTDGEFLAALDEVEDSTPIPGWPERIDGTGTPCQPRAFVSNSRRLAFVEGVNAFPKSLARDVEICRETEVVSLMPSNGVWRATTTSGDTFGAPSLVLAMSVPQMLRFLEPLSDLSDDVPAATHLLGMLGTHPCLTVLATYPEDRPAPAWDISYPGESQVIHLISHDSTKRTAPRFPALVYQALPAWSAKNLDEPPERWSSAVLEEAGRLLGPWAQEPQTAQAHQWRFARADRGMELAGPMLIDLPTGPRLGLAGEVFSRGAGVEAAWSSGRRLARRLFSEDSAR